MQSVPEIRIPAGDDVQTDRIQAAIDCAPVRVVLEAGGHVSGGLRLRSDVTLHLDAGAELQFLPDYDAYADTRVGVVAEQSDRAMICAENAERIALTGAGRVICEGVRAFSLGDDAEMGTRIPAALRPRVLVLERCREVALQGITVCDSPMWTLHFVGCSDVTIAGVHVDNDRRMPNTDGIVIDGCQRVSIIGSEIRTADDGIVLKTSLGAGGVPVGPCSDIQVADCLIESQSCALKIGTESHDDFRRVRFEDCAITGSNRALGIFSRDGGVVEDVRFARIRLDSHETPAGFWGSGEALTLNTLDRRPDTRPAGAIRGVVFEDITGQAEGAINLWAERPGGIADVRLSRVALTQTPGALGTAHCYDLRPTPADLEAAPEAQGRMNAWRKGPDGRIIGLIDYPGGMPGVFAHNVTGLAVSDLAITRPDPLPEGWNPVLVVED